MNSIYLPYISKKQIGVIFANWKRGNLTLTEEQVKILYNEYAERRGYRNSAPHLADRLDRLSRAIDAVFAKNYAEAQETLDIILDKDAVKYL